MSCTKKPYKDMYTKHYESKGKTKMDLSSSSRDNGIGGSEYQEPGHRAHGGFNVQFAQFRDLIL